MQGDKNGPETQPELVKVDDGERCDTPGDVCIEMLNDTPGIVDNDYGRVMEGISREKPI